MNQMISIIVPIYNCEQFLSSCLESILHQSHCNLQIILVNDGSTDNSRKICDSYADKDPRIQVIHQENRGVSAARNAGLEIVSGEWIVFVDSDDCIEPSYCQDLLSAAERYDTDVVIARPTDPDMPHTYLYKAEEVALLKKACLAYDELAFGYNIDAPWGKLFRREIIASNRIRFPENLSRSEDAWFCASVYEHSCTICCLNRFGYIHAERSGSLCRRFTLDAPTMLERILNENHRWVQQYHPKEADYHTALWHRVLPGIDECEKAYFLHDANPLSKMKKAAAYHRFIHSGMVGQAIRSLNCRAVPKKQYRVRLLIYKLHLGWLFFLIKVFIKKV